jgi:hypothetical protein
VTGRFIKGQSGNPSGRPRGPVSTRSTVRTSAFDVIIDKTLTVTINGREREITIDEALQRRTYQEAIDGNRHAQRAVFKMIAKREKVIAANAPERPSIILEHEYGEPGNANLALQILGIATDLKDREEPNLKLETWSVQAALDRKRSEIIQNDIDYARHDCREPQAVVWLRASDK